VAVTLPEVFFGGAPIGGLYSAVSDDEAAATLTAAWQSGVRAFDTAPHYGVGLSERRIGDFLAGRPRPEFVVSTKVGRRLVPADGDVQGADGFFGTPALTRVRDYSRDGVRATLEDSLCRLRLDQVDIALVHDPDDYLDEAVSSALPALAELRDEGLVGMIGAGMNSAAALTWLVERAEVDCVLVAGRYTLLDQSAATRLLPLCQQRGVRVLAGGVFNSGILADPDGKARFDYAPATQQVRERVASLRYGCEKYGVPVGAAALRFALRHPAVTSVVIGARTPAEITADVGYLNTPVPDELFAELTPPG
jgi:D-threo-aldose 1-dehydrogenase